MEEGAREANLILRPEEYYASKKSRRAMPLKWKEMAGAGGVKLTEEY